MEIFEYLKHNRKLNDVNISQLRRVAEDIVTQVTAMPFHHPKSTLSTVNTMIDNVYNLEQWLNTKRRSLEVMYEEMANRYIEEDILHYEMDKKLDITAFNDDVYKEDFVELVQSRIKKFTGYQYPALEINPRFDPWTQTLVACDPVFIASRDLLLLENAKEKFNELYRRRILSYFIEDTDLSPLPQSAFALVFCWDTFEFSPIPVIEEYLEQIYKLLRPGGVLMFSYSNCMLEKTAVKYIEGYYRFNTKQMMIDLIEKYGYELNEILDDQFQKSWAIVKKPGNLPKGIKNIPAIGYNHKL
jgi:SAM-dependent methyltransferase